VHDLAVALLCAEPAGEAALLEYLAHARRPPGGGPAAGRPLYDPHAALRAAREAGRTRACVALMCDLGLWDDAAAAALGAGDLDLARTVASSPPEDEEGVRRRLWLALARHVANAPTGGGGAGAGGDDSGEQAASAARVMGLLAESGGLLRVEDVLPLFPDFATLAHFRAAICEALGDHNRAVEGLRGDMDEATDIAEAVRRDLRALESRVAAVGLADGCARCGRPLGEAPLNPGRLPSGGALPPLYAFPSGLAFHAVCCAAEVLEVAPPAQAGRIRALLARLAKLPADARSAPGGGPGGPEPASVAQLRAALEAEVAAECPRNGDAVLRWLDRPFVADGDADRAEAESWAV
jgi:hypothetical protein